MEEYERLHNIPIDVTADITHDEFVIGAKNKTIGFKVMQGEPITLVRGGGKTAFNFLVSLYLIAPLLIIPVWAYHERNWWLLIGIVVASFISQQLTQLTREKIGPFFLLATAGFWFCKGIHNYYTFFSLCALWGYVFFVWAEDFQNTLAMQALIENPELFRSAIEEKRILIIRQRNS